MADLNALIAQGAQFAAPVDPFAQYGKMQQLQQADSANQLHRMQMDEYQRARMEEEGTRNYLRGKDLSSPETRTGLTQFGKTGLAYAKALTEQDTAAANLGKTKEDIRTSQSKAIGTGLLMAADNPTDEVLARVLGGMKTTGLDTTPLEKMFQQTTDLTERKKIINSYATQHPEGIAALNFVKPDPFEVKRADGSTIFIDKNPNSPTFKTEVLPAQAAGMTPFQKGTLANQSAGLGLHAITADPFNLSGAQTAFPLGGGAGAGRGGSAITTPPAANVPKGEATVLNAKPIPLSVAINQGVRGSDLLAIMPAPVASQVAAITDHRAAPPSRGTARADQLMQLVQLVDPTYDATSFKTKQGIETAFTSGRPAGLLKSLNVVQDHMAVLSDTAKELGNSEMPFVNAMANKIQQWTGQPAPTNFAGVKSIVADELTKAILGTAGALGDRKTMQDEINSSNSPAQLAGVVNKWQKLIAGQVSGLSDQYKSGGGSNPEVIKLFGKAKASAATGGAEGPKAGTIQNGYRFKGGNPADQTNWEKL